MFGQLVIGPPGSGKTTYCTGIQQFLSATGRKVAVINLDPANDVYRCGYPSCSQRSYFRRWKPRASVAAATRACWTSRTW